MKISHISIIWCEQIFIFPIPEHNEQTFNYDQTFSLLFNFITREHELDQLNALASLWDWINIFQ